MLTLNNNKKNHQTPLRQEGNPPEDVLAEVPHGAAGERGIRVDVLIVIEPFGKFDLEWRVEL